MTAREGDAVVMWLRVKGSTAWSPELSMYRPGSQRPLVYSRPSRGEDAHIPYQDYRLDSGWDFYEGGEYRLELTNHSYVEGRFEFVLECLDGPCDAFDPGGDDEDAGDPDAGHDDSDAGNDGGDDEDAGDDGGDDEDAGNDDSGGGDSPYADLRDNALRSALKATHNSHQSLGYNRARDFIFEYDMEHTGPDGEIECVYTGRTAFIDGRRDAQSNHNYNTEHTWPQSRGASGVAKSDIHHLYVVDAPANSRRANYLFGDVVDVTWSEGGSKLGKDAAGQTRFEVRDSHKGNVARAIFYFAVVYDYPLAADEEETLRRWNIADPVDAAERARNDAIEAEQNNRNFFIDWPELVDQISDY